MDESTKKIFNDSARIINKLQLLSVFFENELIFKIYIRTQVIHKLFESNKELDIHKLDMFHIQYTETIIELLKKIKKNNEKVFLSILDEIEINKGLINRLTVSLKDEENYEYCQQVQTVVVGESIYKLYQNLSDYSTDNPFPRNISEFSQCFGGEYFNEISENLFNEMIDYNLDEIYKNGYGSIEKRLLGLQCKHEFKNEFILGLKSGGSMIEVYKIANTEEYFIFYLEDKVFLHCPFPKIAGINPINTVSKKTIIIQELTEKNNELIGKRDTVKTTIPGEVHELLTDYHNKISGIDFLDLIDDFDIQANILKTMLNTDSM